MRAVIYARYSSDLQRDDSIEDQIRLCRERIAREGWQLVASYTDAAVSGAHHLRPGYQKLLEDARSGAFDVVISEALDRLSRDQEHVAALYKRLRFCGVMLWTLAEGEITALHVGLKGTMNSIFLKDLADKTRRGLRGRVEAGRSAGGLCYGYSVVRETAEDGMLRTGGRRVSATEAAVINRIFREFADGKSPRRIAHDLNAAHIHAPGGTGWGASTINGNATRGTGILNNELYIGRLVWNRLRYMKDPDTGRRVSRLNLPHEWVVQDVPELRIVDQDLWDAVKARQDTVKRDTRSDRKAARPFWDRRRPKYLFSGLMRCGCCGGAYTKISENLFGCATARNKGTCANRMNIRRDILETTVLSGLHQNLMDPQVFKEFAEEFYREINRLRMAESAKLNTVRAELERVGRRLRKIVDAIADGAAVRTLKDELLTLETRQDELKGMLANAQVPEPLIHPNLAEVYRRRVSDLHVTLNAEESRAEAAELIRSLVEEVTLTPEDGELRIDLKGELAGILDLAADSKKPATQRRSGLEQIKMVAGARNHLYRTVVRWP